MNTFISFVTRCCNRSILLQNNIDSVTMQTSLDWEQVFLLDREQQGLLWANAQLHQKRHTVKGEWVYILDDDCKLIDSEFVSELQKMDLSDANVVMVKSRRSQLRPNILPGTWGDKVAALGDKPSPSSLNCLCYVVRRHLWIKHIHAFSGSHSGAWTFPAAFWPDAKIAWLDRIVAETIQLGRGKKFETVKSGWWDRIVQRNALQPDGAVWRREG